MYPAAQERLHQALAHCFAQTLAEFLDWIFQKFPQCGETAAARIKVHGVVVNNPVAEERAIASFYKSLNRDVTEQCSYGKAVQHLTGRPLTLHGVAHYKDANIMLHDANLPSLLAAVQPLQKYESCEKDERPAGLGFYFGAGTLDTDAPRLRKRALANIKRNSGGHSAAQNAATFCAQRRGRAAAEAVRGHGL